MGRKERAWEQAVAWAATELWAQDTPCSKHALPSATREGCWPLS